MSDRAAPARPAKFIQERVLFDGIRDDVAVLTLTFRAK